MKKYLAGVFVTFAAFFGTAHAALDAAITTAISDLQADAVTLMGLIIVAVAAVTAIVVSIKIFKRGARQL